jgi:hypothetical protein
VELKVDVINDFKQEAELDLDYDQEIAEDADSDRYGDEVEPEEDAAQWQKDIHFVHKKARGIIKMCKRAGVSYTDNEFPVSYESIYPNNLKEDIDETVDVTWMRAKDFTVLKGQIKLWENAIPSDHVNQGKIGDCFLLSSISGVAEQPVAIRAMFYTKKYNSAGVFVVHFFVNGLVKAVLVDDFFPCINFGAPAFAHGRQNEIWINVMEKAWAKLHGSYAAIEGAISKSCAMAHLTVRLESRFPTPRHSRVM